jgi:hypothetical protein
MAQVKRHTLGHARTVLRTAWIPTRGCYRRGTYPRKGPLNMEPDDLKSLGDNLTFFGYDSIGDTG